MNPRKESGYCQGGEPQGCCGSVVASVRGCVHPWGPRPLTDRKAWTMSALMLLRGLSFSTRKICSSLSKEIKFPNQDRFASLSRRGWLEEGQEGAQERKTLFILSLPFPVSLTLEKTPASNWTSLRRWALGRGGHGQHLSLILVSSTIRASRPSVY